jgi:hypothetical protein
MTTEELTEVLRLHTLWLEKEPGGVHANLQGANLWFADLRGANLRDANLYNANLQGANLRGVVGYVCGGWDSRGHHFRGNLQDDGTVRITAGCRKFSLEEAREHWKDNPDALSRVETISLLEKRT